MDQWIRICLQCRRPRFNPWVGKIPCRWKWLPTPVFLPGESHGQRNLEGYSLWRCKELDTTERLNNNPLQCSCLENSMDRGAWWPAVHGESQRDKHDGMTFTHTLQSDASRCQFQDGAMSMKFKYLHRIDHTMM